MSTQFPPIEMPWYKSKVIVGALVSMAAKILVFAGVIDEVVGPEDAEQLAEIIVMVIGGIGDAVAIGARVRQKHAPAIK